MPPVRRIILWVYGLAMLALFFFPMPRAPFRAPSQFDKMVHFALFLGFAVLYRMDRWPPIIRVLVVSAGFAGGVELVQGLLRYRSAEVLDFVAGALGALVGVLLIEATRRAVNSQ
jgi:VanZ family protein